MVMYDWIRNYELVKAAEPEGACLAVSQGKFKSFSRCGHCRKIDAPALPQDSPRVDHSKAIRLEASYLYVFSTRQNIYSAQFHILILVSL
jgi:hypothetical protein